MNILLQKTHRDTSKKRQQTTLNTNTLSWWRHKYDKYRFTVGQYSNSYSAYARGIKACDPHSWNNSCNEALNFTLHVLRLLCFNVKDEFCSIPAVWEVTALEYILFTAVWNHFYAGRNTSSAFGLDIRAFAQQPFHSYLGGWSRTVCGKGKRLRGPFNHPGLTPVHIAAYWPQCGHKIWVNVGLGNGLLPDGTKPLPAPLMVYPL